MKVGIDIMGGDFAPEATVIGAIEAQKALGNQDELFLFGKEEIISSILKARGEKVEDYQIVDCPDTIEMGENPAKAFANKPASSVVVGYSYLKRKLIDGFASAGSTGAMLVGAMQIIKSIPGIIRPSIASALPKLNGGLTVVLDVGINPDCRPDVLYQYGVLGSIYSREYYKIKDPKVALLNIGSEEGKGNLLTKSAYDLMKDSKDFNFSGNIEAFDIFSNQTIDVIVCDGFVGNVILKQAEAFYEVAKARNINDEFINKLDFEQYGAIPLLGINSVVMIGHGISKATAIKNMIIQTKNFINCNIIEKIKEAFN